MKDSLMIVRTAIVALVLAASAVVNFAGAETITMNLDPYGTTSNLNVFGTVVTDGSAAWPTRSSPAFRDYQFELTTTSGSAAFDSFAVRLSAQLRNQTTSYGNLLRASLWAGPLVPNPVLADALVTVTTPNSAFTSGTSSYSSVILTGSSFGPFTITSATSTFFFRVWAEGSTSNQGYQTKMADQSQFQSSVTMDPSSTIDGFIEYDTNFDGTIDSGERIFDPIAEVVPEPSTLALGASGACLAIVMGFRRRRAAARVSGQRVFES